jgi:TM2 domain-containing membrane protein YozV
MIIMAKKTKEKRSEDTVLAAILLSVVFPGLGQLYNKDFGKAILIWIALIFFAALSLILIGIPLLILLYFYNVYDAYKTANAKI